MAKFKRAKAGRGQPCQRHIRECVEAIREECAEHGAEFVEVRHGGKHPFAVIRWQGHDRRVTLPGSPANPGIEAARARCKVRVALRDIESREAAR